MKPIGAALDKTLRKLTRKFGLGEPELLAQWPRIVGPDLAAMSMPEKLRRMPDRHSGSSRSILTIRVAGPAALHLQHLEPQILERINAFYGRAAVSGLKFVQAPLPRRAPPRAPLPAPAAAPSPEDLAALHAAVSPLPAGRLRDALLRLGMNVRTKTRS